MKTLLFIVLALFITTGSSAQSDFSGRSWSASVGFAQALHLPYTNQLVEHFTEADGSRLVTEFTFRQGRHLQLQYGRQYALNKWFDFIWVVHCNSWRFFTKEELRYEKPLSFFETPSNGIPPMQSTTHGAIGLSSISILPGIFSHVPLNERFSWRNSIYLGLMTQLGNIYPDEHSFYRSTLFELGVRPMGIYESGFEYRISALSDRASIFTTYQWAFVNKRDGPGFWQNVPGFRQLQLGIRMRN